MGQLDLHIEHFTNRYEGDTVTYSGVFKAADGYCDSVRVYQVTRIGEKEFRLQQLLNVLPSHGEFQIKVDTVQSVAFVTEFCNSLVISPR